MMMIMMMLLMIMIMIVIMMMLMIIIMSMIMLSLLLPASILLSFGPRLKIFQLTISSTSPSRWATSTWVWWFFAPTSSCALIEKKRCQQKWLEDKSWLTQWQRVVPSWRWLYSTKQAKITPLLIANRPTRTLNGSHNSLVLLQWTCFFKRNWTDKCWYILGICELFFHTTLWKEDQCDKLLPVPKR